jgi:hypothetical protein
MNYMVLMIRSNKIPANKYKLQMTNFSWELELPTTEAPGTKSPKPIVPELEHEWE